MNRKDSEKDSERPHYYSQFWLDVAAGRRIIGQPKPSDDADLGETEVGETDIAEPAPQDNIRHIQRDSGFAVASDGRANTIIHPVAEPVAAPEEFVEPVVEVEAEEPDYTTDEVDDLDLPVVEEADIPDMDLSPIAEEEGEEETEDFLDEEEEEEEEEDLDWSGRGRKKPKPARPVKQPKKPRRDTRRTF